MLAEHNDVTAGPFVTDDFEQIIPSDKKLSKQWIDGESDRHLTELIWNCE